MEENASRMDSCLHPIGTPHNPVDVGPDKLPWPTWCEPRHTSTSLRRVHPTTMGLTPPSFLFCAVRVTPKKQGWANEATSPARTKLSKMFRDCSTTLPPFPAEILIMSFKCWGRSPPGPPAELHRKEQMALTTSSDDTWMGGATLTTGEGSPLNPAERFGGECLSCKASRVPGLGLAMVS